MVWFYASLAVLIFAFLLTRFDLIALVKHANASVKSATRVLKDRGMSDDEKEKHVQAASLQLFKVFFLILAISIVCLGVPLLFLYALEWLDFATVESVVGATLTWQFLVPTSIIAIAIILVQRRR